MEAASAMVALANTAAPGATATVAPATTAAAHIKYLSDPESVGLTSSFLLATFLCPPSLFTMHVGRKAFRMCPNMPYNWPKPGTTTATRFPPLLCGLSDLRPLGVR
eukprot:COSAG03_NODE_280_length_9486_cov_3.844572_11_plen_106_part_00